MNIYRVNLHSHGRITGSITAKGKKAPPGGSFPFAIYYQGQWRPAFFDPYGLAINLSESPLPRLTKTAQDAPGRPRMPQDGPKTTTPIQDAPQVTYESWKIGQMDHGPKIKAPRGLGTEWQARLYCERAIDRARRYAYNEHTSKNYHPGSYNDRRRRTRKSAHRQAWAEGIKMAEAVCRASEGNWQGKKDLVKEAFNYTSYLLELAG